MVDEYRRNKIAEVTARYVVSNAGDDYDPHDHRDIENATNYFESLLNILKGSLGTGLLALPIAFKYAGLMNGVFASIFATIICGSGIHLFFNSQYQICKTLKVSYMPYSVIMEVAILSGPGFLIKSAAFFGFLCDFLLVVHQTGACAAYIIFMADNIKDLVEKRYTDTNIHVEYYMLALSPLLLLIVSVPNMKLMARVTLVSNFINLICVIILFAFLANNLPDISLRNNTGTVTETAFAVGIMLFSLSAMGVIITVEKHMKKPKQMVSLFGTQNVSLLITFVMYTAIGFIGYWKMGEEVKDIIILDLQTFNETAGKSVQSLYVVIIYVSYGLNAMVPVEILWKDYLQRYVTESEYGFKGLCLTRIVIVVVTTLAAVAIPLFGDVVSLLGSFGLSSLQLIFPAIIHICVHWPDKFGVGKWILIRDLIVMGAGIGGLIIGSYSAVLSIMKHLKERRG